MNIAFIYRCKNIHILRRSSGLAELGHEIHYIGFQPADSLIDLSNFKKIKFFNISNLFSKLTVLDFIFASFKIKRYLKENKIDILHVQSPIYCLSVLFFCNVPIIVENMGSDVLLIKKKDFLRKFLISLAYFKSKSIIQDSFTAKKAGVLLGAKSVNNYVIDVGVNMNIFNRKMLRTEAKQKLGIFEDTKIIFSPRAMGPNYNIDLIIKSARLVLNKIPNVIYIFASPLTNKSIIKSIKKLQLKYPNRVRAVGYLDNTKDLPIYMRASDVIISIPTSDSSPLTVLEAMASGAPVIASKNIWYKGKFVEGKHLYVTDLNHQNIAKKTIEVLTFGSKVVENAYQRVQTRYSNLFCSRRLEALYNKVLRKCI